MAKQRAAGALDRQYHTDWEHMTDKQKFDFLYGWCHKLEATLEGRRKVIFRINAELQKVQKKLEDEI
jgi:thymidylate synthase